MSPVAPRGSPRGPRRGFYWQDLYAAFLGLRCLAKPEDGILAIEPEAPDCQHVDDIVVYHENRLRFLQLKHVQGPSPVLTGFDLFGRPSSQASLVEKLYRGWKRIQARAGCRVEIALVTNAGMASDPRNLLLPPRDFDRWVLRPLRTHPQALERRQHEIVEKIRALVGEEQTSQVIQFLSSLYLEPFAPDESQLLVQCEELLKGLLRSPSEVHVEAGAWIAHVYDVATSSSAIRLDRGEIDKRLRRLFGGGDRLSEHRLALPEHHIPRPSLASNLLRRADELRQGVLRVLGPPGCGKTTFATWFADNHQSDVLMRYHVFDPRNASGVEVQARSGALHFVRSMHDVLSARFPDQLLPQIPHAEALDQAIGRLRVDLARLSEGKPRLVLVDGIDHVVRSSVARPSLFDALPRPVPNSIVFVLFGQPHWEYPEWLRGSPSIDIPPFTREEVHEQVSSRFAWPRSDPGAAAIGDRLFSATEGNPLSIFYNLSLLEPSSSSPETAQAALGSTTLFRAAPRDEYQRLLADVSISLSQSGHSKSLLAEVLACLAVSRVSLTTRRLRVAFEEEGLSERAALELLLGLRPVVEERTPGRFRLFHDDFRRFCEELAAPDSHAIAHSRVARALLGDWDKNELESLCEHLWAAGEYEQLATLQRSMPLEDWLQSSPQEQIQALYRLSLAASFRTHDELLIFKAALDNSLAIQALGFPRPTHGELRPTAGLVDWSFVVPPTGTESRALRLRASALTACANKCAEDSILAAQIAARFLLDPSLEAAPDDEHEYERQEYDAAAARWLLRSGRIDGLAAQLRDKSMPKRTAQAIVDEIRHEKDSQTIRTWSDSLVGNAEWLDRELIGVALERLVEGDTPATIALAGAILSSAATCLENSRDAAVLSTLVAQEVVLEPAHLSARVRWNRNAYDDEMQYREFYFDGFVQGCLGAQLDIAQHQFPHRFRQALHAQGEAIELARLAWQCGLASGLELRRPGLVHVQQLTELLAVLIGQTQLRLERGEYKLARLSAMLMPPLACSLQKDTEASGAIVPMISAAAREHLFRPSRKLYAMLEALHLLDPSTWREMAERALVVRELPKTDGSEREDWFRYWRVHATPRGIAVPPSFTSTAATASVGVLEKTEPARLAIAILKANTDGSIDTTDAVPTLIDLLVRIHSEPAGSVYDELVQTLALAYRQNPRLFLEEFRRGCEYGLVDAFDRIPADISRALLDLECVKAESELLALAFWILGAANSDQANYAAQGTLERLSQQLACKSDPKVVSQLQRWSSARYTMREPSPSPGNLAGAATEDSSEPAVPGVTAERNPPPSIEDVRLRWLAGWWSAEEYETLRSYLASTGEEGWYFVCDRIGREIAESKYFVGDTNSVCDGLIDLRRCTPAVSFFSAAVAFLESMVRFQPQPAARQPQSSTEGGSESIVHLISRGIDVSSVETVRRSLQSLAALARQPNMGGFVEREMAVRLTSQEPRQLVHALLVLRQMRSRLSESCRGLVQRCAEHPDAWCRWLASSLLSQKVSWLPAPALAFIPAPISPRVLPNREEPGVMYIADASSVRETYVRKLVALLDEDEDLVRSWLEVEQRQLAPRESRQLGWRQSPGGLSFAESRVAESVGRLVSRLASVVAPDLVPVLLAAAARQDPWLAVAGPAGELFPKDWVEVCRAETSWKDGRLEYLLRFTAIASVSALLDESTGRATLARVAFEGLLPTHPSEYPWVAEEFGGMRPPRMRRSALAPLAFLNSPFTELSRDQFALVPRWDLPHFEGLVFKVTDSAGWIDSEGRSLLCAGYGEQCTEARQGRQSAMSWWTEWRADSAWLRAAVPPEFKFIQCWRRERSRADSDAPPEPNVVEFGASEVFISQASSA